MTHRSGWLVTTLLTVVLACVSATDVCGCLIRPAEAIVFGEVRSAAGDPVPAARLALAAWGSACDTPEGHSAPRVSDVTDDLGRYRKQVLPIGKSRQPVEGCVEVRATADDGRTAEERAAVRFGFQGTSSPPDSVRVDIVLPIVTRAR